MSKWNPEVRAIEAIMEIERAWKVLPKRAYRSAREILAHHFREAFLQGQSESGTIRQEGMPTIESKCGRARHYIRFPGIVADARRLGVNRATLYRTLTGEWRLPGLLGRYQKLQRKPEAA